jgi:glycosyltransferase involved in cell wall biosynthesis
MTASLLPKVSVLIPVYNSERYLSTTIDSVLAQNWERIEIIAVNDGSTDGSRVALATYEDRITVIDQENCGAAAARNVAFMRCTGTHVLFLDSDDLIEFDHIEKLCLALARGKEDSIGFGRWARFNDIPSGAHFINRRTDQDLSGLDWLLADMENALPMLQSGMFLLPRVLLERVGGWDTRLSLIDDFEFFLRVISASGGMMFAPEARLYYRSGIANSLSRQRSRKAIESQALSLLLGTGHLLAVENSPRTRRACANMLQAFEYEHYPSYSVLRAMVRARVAELGGADIGPSGPPGFHKLRPWIGWKAARHVQRVAERFGMNDVALRRLT